MCSWCISMWDLSQNMENSSGWFNFIFEYLIKVKKGKQKYFVSYSMYNSRTDEQILMIYDLMGLSPSQGCYVRDESWYRNSINAIAK